MSNLIDCMHLGRDRVIGAYELDGLIVDPGPSSCLEALLEGLEGEPRALLLTHVHLDHAGATGSLVRRFPRLRVYVHEIGAPHLVDPAKLLRSAGRLYGDEMERLWGEVLPVPASNVVALGGGERIEGFRVAYTPGHASHHVAYLHESSGDAFVGDVAGVRIPPLEFMLAPTPPPDIDLDAWERSLETVAEWRPRGLRLTHFGRVDDVEGQLERLREGLHTNAQRARGGDRERFLAEVGAELEAEASHEVAERMRQAAPPKQLWLGLERYWRMRAASGG
ncbi:MAG TPA: MBL fold metallo-hydrolase [Solirubrobacterales bacterium]|nr:MBL fold metallo-hydrolase [Solirubrobacterales bacterium]